MDPKPDEGFREGTPSVADDGVHDSDAHGRPVHAEDRGVADASVTGDERSVVTEYRTEVAHYRKPLLGVPWIAALIVVPALLAALGGLGRGVVAAPAAGTTPTPSTSAAPSSPASAAPQATGPVFELSQDGRTVTASGVVPDAATKTAAITALRGGYGSGVVVVDGLKVDAAAPAVDSAAFTTFATTLKPLTGLIMTSQGARVAFSGVAPNEDAKKAVEDAAKAAFPKSSIDVAGIVVASTAQPPASCDVTQAYVRAVTIETKIQFGSGGAALTPASQTALTKIADAVKKCPDLKLLVAGNTDSVGSSAANLTLSTKRAEAVKAQLVKLGVQAANVTAKGNGETAPIASNTTAAGQATNRRVDIAVQ